MLFVRVDKTLVSGGAGNVLIFNNLQSLVSCIYCHFPFSKMTFSNTEPVKLRPVVGRPRILIIESRALTTAETLGRKTIR